MKRKWLWGILGIVLFFTALAYIYSERIALVLMDRVLRANLTADFIGDLPDGLHLALCGAGGPLADEKRSGPCAAVIAGRHLFLVDAGSGAARNLALMRIPTGRIEAVFLTHYHSDHIDGLGEVMLQRWVNAGDGHDKPLPVYGARGVEDVVAGFNRAYRLDAIYRPAHHGEDIVPSSGAGGKAHVFAAPENGRDVIVWNKDGVKITSFLADHRPVSPSVGYRFDYGGRSITISGDTKKSDNLIRAAQGTDLLVHEALSYELVKLLGRAAQDSQRPGLKKITDDILDYHTSPVEAAEVAKAAKADYLLFHHIVPPLPLKPLEGVFLKGVGEVFDGPFRIGQDGDFLSLPIKTDAIEEDRLR